ncbi:VWFA and cache domain-containing protein 1-like [Hydractinia symbiolongicarpus]|uniref:VWFA and cache domain-containing protein 1-like n=1 Tax=Hydractinia symbiolongicarpus TaxID=13093 RepID=UPI00254AFFBB|nr:VWFA and cache domain-containing protein 1-like [Hydractinia symbiolongicarpus]
MNKFFLVLILFFQVYEPVKATFNADVQSFGASLKDYAKNTLGVNLLEDHYNSITFQKATSPIIKAGELLDKFVEILSDNAIDAKNALNTLGAFIEGDNEKPSSRKKVNDCCAYGKKLEWDNLFQSQINIRDTCETIINRTACKDPSNPVHSIHLLNEDSAIKQFKAARDNFANRARHAYYGAEDGYYIQFPAQNFLSPGDDHCSCSSFDSRLRPWYVRAISPYAGRDIVVAIDISDTMGDRIKLLKDVATILLKTIDVKDRVRVTTYNHENGSKDILDCQQLVDALVDATPAVINKAIDAIQNLTTKDFQGVGGFEYSKAIEGSYRYLASSNRTKIIYIVTAGKTLESKDNLERVIQNEAKKVNCSVTLKAFIVTKSGTHTSLRTEQESYLRASCSCGWCPDFEWRNSMVEFRPGDHDMRQMLSPILNSISGEEVVGTVHFSMPYFDLYGLGTAIDACRRCIVNGKIIGVACIMFLQEELFGLLSQSFTQKDDFYVFLIDDQGTTYVHPKFGELMHSSDRPFPLDITRFEPTKQFRDKVYYSLLRGDPGRETFLQNVSVSTGSTGTAFKEKNMTYIWKRVPSTTFSIAVVIASNADEVGFYLHNTRHYGNAKYHRLDLYNITQGICSVKNEPATTDTSTLKLLNTVFDMSKTYFLDEKLSTVTGLMNYIQNKTNDFSPIMISSIAKNIQEDAIATSVLDEFWKKTNTTESIYAIWRYVGTEDGTTRIYPGTQVHPYYDPRVRGWYKLAKANLGKLTLTEPYVDGWTGTVLVTLSKAIATKSKNVFAGVISIDMSVSYVQSLLGKLVPECRKKNSAYSCVVLNEMGYMIYHDDFLKTDKPAKTHIIEKESPTAKHLIQNGHMIKKFCLGYHRTYYTQKSPTAHIEWFYTLAHLTNTVTQESTDDCPNYELVPINHMNILVLKIRKACTGESLKDIKCSCPQDLAKTCNDTKMSDLTICECPCYQYKHCFKGLPSLESSLVCEPPVVQINITENLYTTTWRKEVQKLNIPDCLDPKCHKSDAFLTCQRLGCEWCYRYRNGSLWQDEKKTYCGYEGRCYPEEATTTAAATTTTTAGKDNSAGEDGDDNTSVVIIAVSIVVVVGVLILVAGFVKWHLMQRKQNTPNDKYVPEKSPPHDFFSDETHEV